MDRKTAGRFLAIVCILITLTTGLMKALFPAVYDLIGSFCLVLVGLSMLAVGIIYCVVPYVRFPFNSRKYIDKDCPFTFYYLLVVVPHSQFIFIV